MWLFFPACVITTSTGFPFFKIKNGIFKRNQDACFSSGEKKTFLFIVILSLCIRGKWLFIQLFLTTPPYLELLFYRVSLICAPFPLQHSVEVTWLVQEVWSSPQTGLSGTARERTAAGGYMSTRTNGCCLMYNCEKYTNTLRFINIQISSLKVWPERELLVIIKNKWVFWGRRHSEGSGTPFICAYWYFLLMLIY